MKFIAQDSKQNIIDRFGRHVSSGKVDFFTQSGFDFIIGRREGVSIYDLDGRRLINCHSNGGVYNLGHRHPQVVEALRQALDELDIGNSHLISEHRALLAERLAAVAPGDLNRVIFGVGGGEAIDMAIKLARGATGRPGIIYAEGGYHGHTGLALAAGAPQYRQPFEPLASGFHAVPFGDLDALAAVVDEHTAAVLLETIPATAGIVIPPEDYFAGVRAICDRHGAVMIIDEVQTGLGRCGAVWGIDTYGVTPDILVTGKGLSGGIYPLSATIYADALDPFMREHPFIHVSTFGGAEVGCYVALKVLDILEEPGFLAHVQHMADVFGAGFRALQQKYPRLVVESRQRGLMMGLKLADAQLGPLMSLIGLQFGILTVYANNEPSVNQILPPLIISEAEAQEVLEALDGMLAQVGEMMTA
ncbi:MAG: aspartate aminotransferase family protein [Chloroflexi bacterium]|nr:aspartate aminotransferase family protein [Chloroflexota bacterium]